MNAQCKICSSESEFYLSTKVLSNYNVDYYKCLSCQFIQTEQPYWIEEAYSNAITKLDIGLVTRNEFLTPIVQAVISKWFDPNRQFIDYGGGYGMLVRMMRDRGFDYYRQDIYCENLFAKSYDVVDLPPFRAELVTAFEVFEHLLDPLQEIEKMLGLGESILFSTNVQPSDNVNPESWWYFTPETGQHISLYSRKSLQFIANRFNLNYVWNDYDIHLFTPRVVNAATFRLITHPRWARIHNRVFSKRETLLEKDYLNIKNGIKKNLL